MEQRPKNVATMGYSYNFLVNVFILIIVGLITNNIRNVDSFVVVVVTKKPYLSKQNIISYIDQSFNKFNKNNILYYNDKKLYNTKFYLASSSSSSSSSKKRKSKSSRVKAHFRKLRHSIRQSVFFWEEKIIDKSKTNVGIHQQQQQDVLHDLTTSTNSLTYNEFTSSHHTILNDSSDMIVTVDDSIFISHDSNSKVFGVTLPSGSSVTSRELLVTDNEVTNLNIIDKARTTATIEKETSPSSHVLSVEEHTKSINQQKVNELEQVFLIEPLALPSFIKSDRSTMTSLELEFDDMIQHLSFSPKEISSVVDHRVRSVLNGIVASSREPAVYRAFQVLFEDLYPLRLAGRIIFKKFKELMAASLAAQDRDVQTVVLKTGLEPEQVIKMRQLFVSVASKLNNDLYITKEQLIQETEFLAEVATDILGLNDENEFLNIWFSNETDINKINFVSLMSGLYTCVEETCGIDRCDPRNVLKSLFIELQKQMPKDTYYNLDPERKKYNDKYDEMVNHFIQWKHLVPQSGAGRRLDIVRGCFVGAENPEVVEALRIVYVDFATLRVAGDIIFKLVSSILTIRARS